MSELRVSSLKNLSGQDLITATTLGLDQVDNTSDLAKPVSTATQAAINALPVLPAGGATREVLAKGSGSDYDVVWLPNARYILQRGVTPSDVPLILSVTGGSTDPVVPGETIDIGSGTSAHVFVMATARAANGLTKTLSFQSTVKNGSVLNTQSDYTFGESGSGAWSLQLQWNGLLGSYVLLATGYATQAVTWEASVEVVVI